MKVNTNCVPKSKVFSYDEQAVNLNCLIYSKDPMFPLGVPSMAAQLQTLLAPKGISQFHRSNTNNACKPKVVASTHMSKVNALYVMAQELMHEVQDFEALCHSASCTDDEFGPLLGACCKHANAFAKNFVDNIIDPCDEDQNFVMTKDTLAAAYVLFMLMVWLHEIHCQGGSFLQKIETDIEKALPLFKDIPDCSQLSRPYLEILIAAVKYGEICSKNNILRVLSLLFRNNTHKLGIGSSKECSPFMKQVYSYFEMMSETSCKDAPAKKESSRKRSHDVSGTEVQSSSKPSQKRHGVVGEIAQEKNGFCVPSSADDKMDFYKISDSFEIFEGLEEFDSLVFDIQTYV
jgi:hypothetical protein